MAPDYLAMYNGICEFCSFNDTSGVVTALFQFYHGSGTSYNFASAEFSLDSKFLYIGGASSNHHGEIWQYDATKTDSAGFMQSEVTIYDNGYSIGNSPGYGLQRGPDQKIYCTVLNVNAMSFVDSLSIITKPDIQGTGCSFQKDVICLQSGNLSEYGFPQFLQRYYVYIQHSGILCSNNSISFTSIIWPPADSIKWNFGDPSSGLLNFSNLANPVHIYSNTGTYNVELYVRHNDLRTDTAWQTITIAASPNVNLGPNRTICIGDSTTFDAGACTDVLTSGRTLAQG